MIKVIMYIEAENESDAAEAMQYASEKINEGIPYYAESNEATGYFEYSSTIATEDFSEVLSRLTRAKSAPEK